MTVMTLNLVEKQPATMRRIIGKHLAVPRWQETCDYYNQMNGWFVQLMNCVGHSQNAVRLAQVSMHILVF